MSKNAMTWFIRLLVIAVLLVAADLQAQTTTRQAAWQDNSTNEDFFIVQQCPGICLSTSTLWKTIGTVGPNITTFLVGPMPVPSTNSYRVGAQNGGGINYSLIVIDDLPPPTITPPSPTTFPFPPCKSLTEILPTTIPKRYLCNP